MIRINLLPHREVRRRRQQQQFFVTLAAVLILAAATWLLVHTSLSNSYDEQLTRNKYLKDEIVKVDKEIEEIKKLRKPTAAVWLVNQLARERQLDVQRLLKAGESLTNSRAKPAAEPSCIRWRSI